MRRQHFMMSAVLERAPDSQHLANENPAWSGAGKLGWAIVAVCLAVILWLTFKDIGEPLMDRHSHRQTQTAISTHYMVTEDAWFPYITPVLGPPWSIPMELPLYQWIVAGVVKFTHAPLELTGRLVSLLFWWLALFELYRALRYFVADPFQRAVLLVLIASAPASIYWSRSFMIETCALYLAVACGERVLRAVVGNQPAAWAWAAVFGTLAALQKITTLFVAEALLGMILLVILLRQWRDEQKRPMIKKNALLFIALSAWLLVIGLGWATWSESVRSRNPLAEKILTGEALKAWNYGTVQQRFEGDTWRHFLGNVNLGFTGSTPGLGYKVPLLLWVAIVLLVRRRFAQQVVLLLAFFSGPLVFMNLYHIHEYYFVANAYLLLLALGFAGVAAWEDSRAWIRKIATVFVLLIVAGQFHGYPRYKSLLMAEVPDRRIVEADFQQMLSTRLAPAETLLVFGRDWDPSVAFYAGRKAIIDKFNGSPRNDRNRALLDELKPEEQIGAMILSGDQRTNQVLIAEWVEALNLEALPQPSFWGDVYFRKKPENK